jgi:hypothetical protein
MERRTAITPSYVGQVTNGTSAHRPLGLPLLAVGLLLAGCGGTDQHSKVKDAVAAWQVALEDPKRDVCDVMPSTDRRWSGTRLAARTAGRTCEAEIVATANAGRSQLSGPYEIAELQTETKPYAALVRLTAKVAPGLSGTTYLTLSTRYGDGDWSVGQVGQHG